MIELTRFNNTTIVLNADLIEMIEETPDTVITMTTGRKMIVKENGQTIIELVKAYRKSFAALPFEEQLAARVNSEIVKEG